MSDNFQNLDGAIREGAKVLDGAKRDLTSKLKHLSDQMDQVQKHWEGAGASAFTNVKIAWTEQANDLHDLLDNFRENLLENDKQYTQDDQGAADMLAKYTSKMGGK